MCWNFKCRIYLDLFRLNNKDYIRFVFSEIGKIYIYIESEHVKHWL